MPATEQRYRINPNYIVLALGIFALGSIASFAWHYRPSRRSSEARVARIEEVRSTITDLSTPALPNERYQHSYAVARQLLQRDELSDVCAGARMATELRFEEEMERAEYMPEPVESARVQMVRSRQIDGLCAGVPRYTP